MTPRVPVIALTILLFSASGAVAQLPPPPIHIMPNLNPSNPLVLPAPGRVTVSPTSPTVTSVSGCCHRNYRFHRHQLKKNHASHRRRNYSADIQEQIAEKQRHAAERAEVAIRNLIGETAQADGRQSRGMHKRRK